MRMTTNESPYPWLNKSQRYTIYAIILKTWSDTLALGTETFLTAIQFAHTTNKWVFDRFLDAYKGYIDITEYDIHELKDYTWDEFCAFIHNRYTNLVGRDGYESFYIGITKFENIDYWLPTTGDLYAKVESDEYTSSIESLAVPLLIESKLFLDKVVKDGYIRETPEVNLIRHMLGKIVDVYITLYYLCINHEYSDHAESGEWFLSLPDSVKIDLTTKAEFPRPIEEIDWCDIMTEDFNLLMWLSEIVGYPDVVDTEEKHSTIAKVDVGHKRKDAYANMVVNYTSGWGYLTS